MGQDPTILICDDEAPLRELVRVSLDAGFRFVEAHDGVEAVELARATRPDLVILDLMLPRLSGVDVVARLRADHGESEPRIVVLSAWTHSEAEAIDAGADCFVAKPFDPEELKLVVDELLRA
jgi:two-component system phosphate regulon response regulator PhoB